MIVRRARIEEAQQTIASENIRHGIHDEQIAGLAIKPANAKRGGRPQLSVDFDVSYETAGAGAGCGLHTRRKRTTAISDVAVVIENGRSCGISRTVKNAHGTRRIASKACLQQGDVVVEKPCSGAKDGFLIFPRRIGWGNLFAATSSYNHDFDPPRISNTFGSLKPLPLKDMFAFLRIKLDIIPI